MPSLELAMDLLQVVGQCDNGYACVYQNNLSWSSPTTPLPAEAHPRIVFESLFGEGGSIADRRAALRKRASLLDAFNDDIARLNANSVPAIAPGSASISIPSAKWSAAFKRPRPTRRTIRCRIWIGRWACPPLTPTTRD